MQGGRLGFLPEINLLVSDIKAPDIIKSIYLKLPVILFLFFCNSCAAQQIQTDFYLGLRTGTENNAENQASKGENQKQARAFFERALYSPNTYIRTAAASEILRAFPESHEISVPLRDRLKQAAPFSWAVAFDILDSAPAQAKDKALAFLLSSGQPDTPFFPRIFPDEAAVYTLRELLGRNAEIFTPAELAAIEGNILVSQSRFTEALKNFRITLEEPELFFRHPDLVNRLGRSFQYAGTGNEGIDLFLDWESKIASGYSGISGKEIDAVRFRLFFYAARMARQQGRHDEGISLFYRALPLAPDAVQSDACVWYILDSVLSSQPAGFLQALEGLMPIWHDKAYYSDILDKLVSGYVLNQNWAGITAVYPLIYSYADNNTIAGSAYIIARALEQGFLPAEETAPLISTADQSRAGLISAFMETAYNSGSAFSYYRFMSAAALKKPIKIPKQERQAGRVRQMPRKQPVSAAMEFLQGFFSNKAAEYAPKYIKYMEKELSPDEKRHLAKSLTDAGLYTEAMRLLSSCADDLELDRHDLEIYYPRPFRQYVEKFAQENNLAPDLLFALIRTESAFQSGVISSAGAVGLTQLLPSTAEETAGRIRRRGGPD